MPTRENYDEHFEQLAHAERKMVYDAYELGSLIEEPFLVGVLKKIGNDKARHYGQVLKILEVIAEPVRFEHRRELRKYCLGTIQLRSLQGSEAEEVSARCVNLSTSGICLESAKALLPGSAWELEIQLFDTEELMGRRGRIVWCKEIEMGLFMSGIEFGIWP